MSLKWSIDFTSPLRHPASRNSGPVTSSRPMKSVMRSREDAITIEPKAKPKCPEGELRCESLLTRGSTNTRVDTNRDLMHFRYPEQVGSRHGNKDG